MADSLGALVGRHLAWLEARGFASTTLEARRRDLTELVDWCAERSLTHPSQLSRGVLDLYQRWIARRPKADGRPLALASQAVKLSSVLGFCRWLARERLVLFDPAAELELPKRPSRLPKAVLTVEEVEKVLAVPDLSTLLGLRNRVILETFYATGIRRAELIALTTGDLDRGRGILAVRQGKGRKDRFVPLGSRALAWLERYVEDVRPRHQRPATGDALFLSARGGPLSRNYLGQMVRRTVEDADIGKHGACHLFRHTVATLMLEGGADIRFIQQMLGHASVATTQVYTQVSLRQLKAVYERSHPAARSE